MPRQYARPPVAEALCEVFFVKSRWESTIPGLFYQSIRERFPKKQELTQMNLAVEVGGEGASTKMRPLEPRSRFLSDDESRMVQIGRDLLVVNQLRPYPRFDDWQPIVIEMLKTYRSIVAPSQIARIGVRYINRIEVPETGHPMESYFRLYPEVPSELGRAHGEFFLRLQIPATHSHHALIVTFGSTATEAQDSSAYVLDLYDTSLATGEDSFALAPDRINEAHENIEHAFENIITNKARALFGEMK